MYGIGGISTLKPASLLRRCRSLLTPNVAMEQYRSTSTRDSKLDGTSTLQAPLPFVPAVMPTRYRSSSRPLALVCAFGLVLCQQGSLWPRLPLSALSGTAMDLRDAFSISTSLIEPLQCPMRSQSSSGRVARVRLRHPFQGAVAIPYHRVCYAGWDSGHTVSRSPSYQSAYERASAFLRSLDDRETGVFLKLFGMSSLSLALDPGLHVYLGRGNANWRL